MIGGVCSIELVHGREFKGTPADKYSTAVLFDGCPLQPAVEPSAIPWVGKLSQTQNSAVTASRLVWDTRWPSREVS